MAQFRLPANSKLVPGKTWKAAPDAKDVRTFRIYRFDPESGENPRVDTYEVDMAAYPRLSAIVDTCMALPAFRDAEPSRQPEAARAPG